MAEPLAPVQSRAPVIDKQTGLVTPEWLLWLQALVKQVTDLVPQVEQFVKQGAELKVQVDAYAKQVAAMAGADGSGLTNLNASNLTTGIVPDRRFPATLPAADGSLLTDLNADELATGTVPDGRFPAILPALDGS